MTPTYGERLFEFGREQGREQGREEQRKVLAQRMAGLGVAEVDIAAYLEITVERVRELVAMSGAPAPLADPSLR